MEKTEFRHKVKIALVDGEGTVFHRIDLELDADGYPVYGGQSHRWDDTFREIEDKARSYAIGRSWTKPEHVAFVDVMKSQGYIIASWHSVELQPGEKRPAVIVYHEDGDKVRRSFAPGQLSEETYGQQVVLYPSV